MKTSYSVKLQKLILTVALSVGISLATPAYASISSFIVNPDGTLIRLGSLGGRDTYARSINDAGQVVGSSSTPEGRSHAFITGPNGVGMTDLGTLGGGGTSEARDINAVGQVVGWSNTHAFITGPNGAGMTDIGTLGGSWSHAYGINNAGQVVGASITATGEPNRFDDHAFTTGPNGMGMIDLNPMGGYPGTVALGINDAGQVTGQAHDAFITAPNGLNMIDIVTINDWDHSDGSSAGHDINAAGQVVGSFLTAFGRSHAFITGPNGVDLADLGTLDGSDISSEAYGINDVGQVVGRVVGESGQSAFITGPDGVGMTNLNSLAKLPDGVYLWSASDINNLGQIIAITINPIPAIPEPSSYALMLAGLALVGFLVRRQK